MNSTKNLDKNLIYYYEVALCLAIKNNLIYSSDLILNSGDCVIVSVRNKKYPAVVLKKVPLPTSSFKIKSIDHKDTQRIKLEPNRLKWLKWLADYYQYNFGQVVHLSFPPQGKSAGNKKDLIESENILKSENLIEIKKPTLTLEQKKCLQSIQSYSEKQFKVHLLHGVTGSGKTEIYFRLIESAIQKKQGVLILVPEITLTPQHINRFSERFPGQVACFHSGLSPKQRNTQWMTILNREKQILIGPRSALFCPIPNLSWIIVDEEHEVLFKQEERLKYHGRDAAVYLGKCLQIPVVLASATPSLESWWNASSGKYIYHNLKDKVFKTKDPKWEIVDMKKEKNTQSVLPYWLSKKLHKTIQQSLEQKEQVALFLNRRGETGYIFCPACSYHFNCVNCDISLTQHKERHLICHYCGYREEKPDTCPECGEDKFFSFGVGTALLEKQIKSLFPSARIVRADRDEVRTHKQWEIILNRIEKKEVDILIGTQMISKGLDFSYLNVVGFILADQGLNNPDFRSAEKSFQLITQMAGRAGRRKKSGKIILQTYNPSHPVIKAVTNGDYKKFADQELLYRKQYMYPPFGKLALVRVQSISSDSALKVAMSIQKHLKKIKNLTVLGPVPAYHFRLHNKYRYHLLLKSPQSELLNYASALVLSLIFKSQIPPVQIHINRDPVNML